MDTYWSEIGIDSKTYKENFVSKKLKASSLKKLLSPKSLTYIRNKFKRIEIKDIDALKKLIDSDLVTSTNIYIVIKSTNSFSTKKIKDYYKNTFNQSESDVMYCMLRMYFEKKEILKDIFYATLLEIKSGGLDTYTLKTANPLKLNGLDTLTEKNAQAAIRKILKKSQKKKINVWFVLKNASDTSIFVYKQAKTRARIPNPVTKRYSFFVMAKPIIIQFSDSGKKVSIFSKEKDRTLKMAKSIICYLSNQDINDTSIFYDKKILTNGKNLVDTFINKVIKEQDKNFISEYVRFLTVHDPLISVSKRTEPISGLVNDMIEKNYIQGNLDSNTVEEMGLLFKNKQFRIFISKNEGGGYDFQYSSKTDFSLRKEFEDTLKSNYSIEASKRG